MTSGDSPSALELCRSYLDARWHFDPAAASAAGLAAHDGRLGRFDEAGVRELLAALRSLAGAAEELDVADQDEEIDRTALLDELRVAIFRFQHEAPHRRNPAFWLQHLLEGLHAVAARPELDASAAGPLVERLRAVPDFLTAARETLAVSEEAGASPPQTPQARAQQVLRALLIMDVS